MDPFKTTLVLTACLMIAVALRFGVLGVQKQLFWLVVFLIFSGFQLIVPALAFPVTSRLYRDFYVFSEPVVWMLSVLMIQEMYHLVFARYPAISGLGKFATYGAAISAVAVCTFMLAVTPAHQLTPRVIQTYTVFWEMCMLFALGVFIVFMIAIVGRYPMQLDPNLKRNIAILSLYFFGSATILAVSPSDRGHLALQRAFVVIGLQAVCALLWGILIRKPLPITPADPIPNDAEAEHLLRQLAQINNMLARSARQ